MAKNLISAITHMLGVEIGEDFKVKGDNELTYRFTNDGLELTHDSGIELAKISANVAFADLLNGTDEIVKLPWKPKEGTDVYTFSFTTHEYNSRFCPHKGVWYITKWNWAGFPWQIAALDKGWVYRTKEEAKAALPKVAAEMGVEYELPTSDTEAVEPWKPKKGEKYWGFWYSSVNDAWLVLLYTWANNPADFALYKVGWVYRTREEAQAALPKVAAELGVEYEV